MTLAELNRTSMQALWNHLPRQPYNWETKASVVGLSPRQVSALDIAEDWVKPQLRRLIRPFAEAISGIPNGGPELDVVDRGQFALVQADDLRAERFPNTFLCQICAAFVRPSSIGSPPTCPNGHGPMRQFSFVEVHTCGEMRPLTPPRCGNGCRAQMALVNTRSLSQGVWAWRCGRCGTDAGGVLRWCACGGGRFAVSRVPQTTAFYPQQITVLNPPTRSGHGALAGPLTRQAAIAQSIGSLPPGQTALMRAVSSGGATATDKAREALEALNLKPGDPMYDQLMATAAATGTASPGWQSDVDALGLSPETLEVLGDECLQLSLTAGAAPLAIADLAADAAGTSLQPFYASYAPLLAKYKFSDVTLLRQLPIAFIVAGYTRLSARSTRTTKTQTVPVKFNFFPDPKSGKFPMYGIRSETEGLLFRVDQLEVVKWLVASGVVADPRVATREEAQKWLMQVMDPVVDIFNKPDSRITEAVLGLIHSMSHRTMKSLAARSGLNVDSLAEYLFPSSCSFVIYANTRSQFTLGGIEHVFRFDLADALSELDAETRCMFDPPCRRSFGGACVACLHVSEIACQRFNSVLDRNLLYGELPQSTLSTGAAAPTAAAAPPVASGAGVAWTAFW